MNEAIQDIITINGESILEMVLINPRFDVPVHPSIDIATITADDPDPKFVNVETVRSEVTSGNGRNYTGDVVRQISAMTPGIQGYLGHNDPSKYGFEFREPQCIFVGSMVDEMETGHVRAIAKAYLFKTSNLREWIPKSIAANNPMTVSINGRGDLMRRGDYVDVMNMTKLESIDWANPGTEGLGTSQAISVVKEMNNNNGGTEMEVKDILKNASVTEFKVYNPDGYNGIISSVTLTELNAHNPNLVKAIQEAATITEMKVTVGGTEKSVKLTEMQGIISGLEEKISEMASREATEKLDKFKTAKIVELIPEDLREQVSKRVVGNTEADIEASINAEIGYIREMRGLKANDPIGRNASSTTGGEDIKEQVAGLFGVKKPDSK